MKPMRTVTAGMGILKKVLKAETTVKPHEKRKKVFWMEPLHPQRNKQGIIK